MVKSGTRGRRERRPAEEKNHGVCGRYKGVRMRKWGRWVAEVRRPNSRSRIWLGSYDTPQEAARAYDAALFCLRGPSALLNFPANPPEMPSGGDLSPSGIQKAAFRHAHKFQAEADNATPKIPEEMKCPAEHQEGYNLAMAAVRVHDGDDGLACNAHHYQSSRLRTF